MNAVHDEIFIHGGSASGSYAGGSYEAFHNDELWCFSLLTRTWSLEIPAGGTRPSGRKGHTMQVVDYKLYIFGGWTLGTSYYYNNGEASNELWVWSPTTKAWLQVLHNNGPWPSKRSGHSMAVVGSNFYIFMAKPTATVSQPYSMNGENT